MVHQDYGGFSQMKVGNIECEPTTILANALAMCISISCSWRDVKLQQLINNFSISTILPLQTAFSMKN